MATIRCGDVTFPNIEAILFDKDGTLANSEEFLRNLAQKRSRLIDAQVPGVQEPLLMAFGLEGNRINPAGMMAVGSRPENEIAAAAYVAETGRDWMAALDIVRSAFMESDRYLQPKAEFTPLFDGAIDLFKTLTDAQLKLGIVSADLTTHVKDFVQTYQINHYFPLQLGIDGWLSKIEPRFVQFACEQLQVSPRSTLIVGDSQADVQMAKIADAAGAIGVTWGWTKWRNSQPTTLQQADIVISEFNQILVID